MKYERTPPSSPHHCIRSIFLLSDHSIYDSFSWVDNYGDPGFHYFQAAARLWGLMALRLANCEMLPFDPTAQAAALEDYLDALMPSHNKRIADAKASVGGYADHYDDAAHLSETDYSPLKDAVANFRKAAQGVGSWAADIAGDGHCGCDGTFGDGSGTVPVAAAAEARAVMMRGDSSSGGGGEGSSADGTEAQDGERHGERVVGGRAALNERLAMTERRFLTEEGLPGRRWFRHVLQAPGLYLG